MKKITLLVLLACIVFASVPGDGVVGCTGHENPFSLIDTEPTLEKEVKNGRKYTVGKYFQ